MKKNTIIAILTAMILGLASLSYAGYAKGFKVIAVKDGQVTIQKGESEPVEVAGVDGKFKVGDQVKYDADDQKIRKEKVRRAIEGC